MSALAYEKRLLLSFINELITANYADKPSYFDLLERLIVVKAELKEMTHA